MAGGPERRGSRCRPPGAARVRRRARGFTMAELVIAILILLILASLAAPAVKSGVRNSKLNAAASEVASALRRARNMAIAKGRPHCAHFVTPPHNRVDSYEGRCTVRLHPLLDSQLGVLNDAQLNVLEDAGGVVLPEETWIVRSVTYVCFLPDGSAWAPGLAVLAAEPVQVQHRRQASYSGDHWYTVKVRPLSGRVELERRAPP